MSQATYQLNRNNSQSSTRINYDQRYNNIDMNQYSSNNSGKEKDMLISQLKSKIFELELHEKDYDVLNERYKQLQIDFAALNDSKHLLECEKEKRDEEYNKLIGDLQCENENLQIGFNDKLTKNKNCFSQNSMLQKQLELKDNEIYDLTAKLNDLENQFCRNEDERANLQKLLNGLNDIKNSQNYKIEQLIEDNKTLKQICEEQDNDIKAGNEDRENLCKELEKKNNDIANLNSQIRGEINEINNLQNQLNKNNGLSLQYESNIKDYQRQIDFFKRENESLKNNIYKEKAINSDEDQKNKKKKPGESSSDLEEAVSAYNEAAQIGLKSDVIDKLFNEISVKKEEEYKNEINKPADAKNKNRDLKTIAAKILEEINSSKWKISKGFIEELNKIKST